MIYVENIIILKQLYRNMHILQNKKNLQQSYELYRNLKNFIKIKIIYYKFTKIII